LQDNLNQKSKLKMQNDNEKFKNEFKRRLYEFVLKLIKFIDVLNRSDPTCRIISDQLLRSTTSVLANYTEARSASYKKDFINFFTHSLKSANESKMWLTLLGDSKKCKAETADKLLKELIEIANILASSIITLKGKKSF
jgi:four helix bundle protein